MSSYVELIGIFTAIAAMGVMLVRVIQTSIRGLRQDIRQDMARLEHSQAKLEGLLEGLRKAITGRAAARG